MDLALDLLARYLGDYAYVGLFLILSVGAFGAPIPEEVVLIAAGLFVHQGHTQLVPTLLVCGAGQILGDLLLYMVGRRWGTEAFHGFIRRLVPTERLDQVRQRLDRWGLLVVFFGRYLTGVRPAVFLAAGASGIPTARFMLVDGLSAVVSLFVWVFVGKAASNHIELALQAVTDAEEMILAGLLAILAVLLLEQLLVRLGRLSANSTPVRVTHMVRVPILVVTATFAVILAHVHQIHQRQHLIAAARAGAPRLVKDMGLLLSVLPAITENGEPPEIVLIGKRSLLEEALAKATYLPTEPELPVVAHPLYARAPEAAFTRGGPAPGLTVVFWRSNLEYRGREVWLGRFSHSPPTAEMDSIALALTHGRFTPRTLLGPRLRPEERRRVLVAVLRSPPQRG